MQQLSAQIKIEEYGTINENQNAHDISKLSSGQTVGETLLQCIDAEVKSLRP